ncbi:hypothetical protein B0H10DRAFT_2442941 [Mycena sp. CBHHK59/15]|nr:hypothetical protein B0H10DRAFT_2442941 [Mycena sp. CBHHK59/15]
MPALEVESPIPFLPSPSPATFLSGSLTIAGHVYTPAQVHSFLSTWLAYRLPYLALVTVPKLALMAKTNSNHTHQHPSVPPNTRLFPARRRHTAAPPSPVPPRPVIRITRMDSRNTRTRRYSPLRSGLLSPTYTADALVGSHPAALPLGARPPPAPTHFNAQQHFPWVPPTQVFGLVRPRLHPGERSRRTSTVGRWEARLGSMAKARADGAHFRLPSPTFPGWT